MKGLLALLILLEVLAGFWLGAVARHGPAGLGPLALVYLATAPALTVFIARRYESAIRLIGGGVFLIVAAPALLLTLDLLESRARAQRIAATEVVDVVDEAITTDAGEVIGVRLGFRLRLPETAANVFFPWLRPNDAGAAAPLLLPRRWRVDGVEIGAATLRPGWHRFEFELLPATIDFDRDGALCRVTNATTTATKTAITTATGDMTGDNPGDNSGEAPGALALGIGETSFGSPWLGGREEFTQRPYSLPAMDAVARSADLPTCDGTSR